MAKEANLNNVTQQIIDALKVHGFKIQYYKSYSTNSFYLKLDYGVSHSIRISDHKGKSHLNYRFNIGPHITDYEVRKTPPPDYWPMYFYPITQFKRMIQQIVQVRDNVIKKYGKERYKTLMQTNLEKNQHKRGFWAQSKELWEGDIMTGKGKFITCHMSQLSRIDADIKIAGTIKQINSSDILWIPQLGPDEELFNMFKDWKEAGKWPEMWPEYLVRFQKLMTGPVMLPYLNRLKLRLSEGKKIAFGCFCAKKDVLFCHRSIVADDMKNSGFEIILG